MLDRRNPDIARRMRVALAEADVKPGQFARLAGLNRAYVSQLLHGRAIPGELAMMKIERALAKLDEHGRRREEVSA